MNITTYAEDNTRLSDELSASDSDITRALASLNTSLVDDMGDHGLCTELSALAAQLASLRQSASAGQFSPTHDAQLAALKLNIASVVEAAHELASEQREHRAEAHLEAARKAERDFLAADEKLETLYDEFLQMREAEIDAAIAGRIDAAQTALTEAKSNGDQETVLAARLALREAQYADLLDAAARGDAQAQSMLDSFGQTLSEQRHAYARHERHTPSPEKPTVSHETETNRTASPHMSPEFHLPSEDALQAMVDVLRATEPSQAGAALKAGLMAEEEVSPFDVPFTGQGRECTKATVACR